MIRRLASSLAARLRWVVDALRPTPGTTEGVVTLGLFLLAASFVMAGLFPLAVGVPGALLVAIGLGFSFRRGA